MKKTTPLIRRLSRWILLTALLFILGVAALNYIADPYGAFGDPVLQWWSYDMTMNPRLAKYQYLQQHAREYDSLLIGGCGSVDYPVEALNAYFGANFYICAGGDLDLSADEQLATALIEARNIKNLVLNLSPCMILSNQLPEGSAGTKQHFKVEGSSPLSYTLRYLFINPLDSAKKLYRLARNGTLQSSCRLFDARTGAYDRSRRDIEPISDLERYLAQEENKVFERQLHSEKSPDPDSLKRVLASVSRIKQLCWEKGIRFLVLCQPMNWKELEGFSDADLALFRNELAEITDYWDFSLSAFSYDPRFFYDPEHPRSDVGRLVLARVFDNPEVQIPAEFGQYVVQGTSPGAPKKNLHFSEPIDIQVPILVYHHLVEDVADIEKGFPREYFEDHMAALSQAGYHPVSLDALRDWVEHGTSLPSKPIVISFDDGYRSNYEIAYPILQRYGFQATIFAIGVSIGKDSYKDTGKAITPHFTLEQAAEMEASGLITIYSHGYDIHEVEKLDPAPIRRGLLQRDDESEADYIAFLQQDCAKMRELLGRQSVALSFPYGCSSELAELILSQQDVFSTLTTAEHCNTLVRCLPQSLRQLGRLRAPGAISGADLIEKIRAAEAVSGNPS